MENSIRDDLCKGLRASGIPKELSHSILNTVEKWYDSNGCEWTVDRIKALRQWYETYLAGEPVPPKWFKHSAKQLPVGVWKAVFDLPTPKALAVLSLSTVFYHDELSESQLRKFRHGLEGCSVPVDGPIPEDFTRVLDWIKPQFKHILKKFDGQMPVLRLPTPLDMVGSVPILFGRKAFYPNNCLGRGLLALRESWASLPQVCWDFLDTMDMMDVVPTSMTPSGLLEAFNSEHPKCVGRIGIIQEPELKARIVANPNRVLQCMLDPLKEVLMHIAHRLPWDCIFDQEEGVLTLHHWLQAGLRIAGSDLTSASDLLSTRKSLKLIEYVFNLQELENYEAYRNFFLEVCESPWYFPPSDEEVVWKSGYPLGTGPSIAVLTLCNGLAGIIACLLSDEEGEIDIPRRDGVLLLDQIPLRVLGDDIVFLSQVKKNYERVISWLGGEINHSKTLESDKAAEFAGRVVTREDFYLKKVKYSEPSDDSFMSYLQKLGPQAEYFLRTRQRRVAQFFNAVPGILVEGPWSHDSHGFPLDLRYEWYLTEVLPALEKADPDLTMHTVEYVFLKAYLDAAQSNISINAEEDLPAPKDSSYLDELVASQWKSGGDPRRLRGGVSLLESLERLKDRITPFHQWLKQRSERTATNLESVPPKQGNPPSKEVVSQAPVQTKSLSKGKEKPLKAKPMGPPFKRAEIQEIKPKEFTPALTPDQVAIFTSPDHNRINLELLRFKDFEIMALKRAYPEVASAIYREKEVTRKTGVQIPTLLTVEEEEFLNTCSDWEEILDFFESKYKPQGVINRSYGYPRLAWALGKRREKERTVQTKQPERATSSVTPKQSLRKRSLSPER